MHTYVFVLFIFSNSFVVISPQVKRYCVGLIITFYVMPKTREVRFISSCDVASIFVIVKLYKRFFSYLCLNKRKPRKLIPGLFRRLCWYMLQSSFNYSQLVQGSLHVYLLKQFQRLHKRILQSSFADFDA